MSLTSFGIKAAPVTSLALFLLAGVATYNVTSNVPAFQPELNITGITGYTRLAHTPAMYDHGAYLFQTAYGYLNADALPFAGTEETGEIVSSAVAAERLNKARDYAEQSLRLDPANAHVWQVYAHSLFAVGTVAETGSALQTSWELGKTTKRLAVARVYLIDAMRDFTGDHTAYSEIYTSDIEVLTQNAPRFLPSKG
jgi:hypothetical protein